MSGWIKMGTGLRDHPKVVRMAGMLKSDCLRVVGALHAVWSVFDEHSPDGLLEFYTLRVMDEKIGWKGFSAAMQAVGWLVESESGLEAPDYEEHNGPSAKRRALDSNRKQSDRAADKAADPMRTSSGQMSAFDADKTQTRVREEKEKSNTPPPPRGSGRVSGFPPLFDAFWAAYPRKVAKDDAVKAFAKRKVDEALLTRMLAAIAAQGLRERWAKGGEEARYVPHPATWLNSARWEDEVSGSGGADDLWAGAR